MIRTALRWIIKIIIPDRIKRMIITEFLKSDSNYDHFRISSSQEGEDMLIDHLLQNKRDGFYIEVGANSPTRFSNSFFFYKKGWRGITIDPNPKHIEQHKVIRRRDISICMGIGPSKGELKYYEYKESAYNTLSEELVETRIDKGLVPISNRYVQVDRLDDVLSKYLVSGTEIDFLSIDVEGLDLDVLMSNDWTRFRPYMVITEVNAQTDWQKDEIISFMEECGYFLKSRLHNSVIFIRKTKSQCLS